MTLVEVPSLVLSEAKTLPFDIFDSGGRLLARRGVALADLRLSNFHFYGVYVDEVELQNWKRQFDQQLVELIDKPILKIGQLVRADLHSASKPSRSLTYQSRASRAVYQLNLLYDGFDLWKSVDRRSIDSSAQAIWHLAERSRELLIDQLHISVFCLNFWARTSYRSSKVSSLLLWCALGLELLDDYSTEVELEFTQIYLIYCVLSGVVFDFNISESDSSADFGLNPSVSFIKCVLPSLTKSGSLNEVDLFKMTSLVGHVLVTCRRYLKELGVTDLSGSSNSNVLYWLSPSSLNRSTLLSAFTKIKTRHNGFLPGELVVSKSGRVGVLARYTMTTTYFIRLFDTSGLPLLEPRLEVLKYPVSHAVTKANAVKLRAYFDLNHIVECGFF